MRILVALVLFASGISVIAGDCSQGQCADTETCCDGSCCPEANAVCCSDGLHCCSANTVCNLQKGTCDHQSKLIPTAFRNPPQATLQVASKAKRVVCPGGQNYCPDDNTCCPLPSGQWGCCPYPSAVCCPNKVHCCPIHTRCGPGHCSRGSSKFAALYKRKVPAFPMN